MVNESTNDTTYSATTDEPTTDIEFPNRRELYNYYGIDIKTIPDEYEVKMRYIRVNGVRGRLYKLVKK